MITGGLYFAFLSLPTCLPDDRGSDREHWESDLRSSRQPRSSPDLHVVSKCGLRRYNHRNDPRSLAQYLDVLHPMRFVLICFDSQSRVYLHSTVFTPRSSYLQLRDLRGFSKPNCRRLQYAIWSQLSRPRPTRQAPSAHAPQNCRLAFRGRPDCTSHQLRI
jgi:hypothetical protein